MINRTQQMMFWVLACLTPGVAASVYFLGHGILLNILICALTALVFELIIATLRDKPLTTAWDGSGTVTAVLLAACLPPDISWPIAVFGAGFAILFGKSLYGGLGQNPFNPAMVGYCALIICFPLEMSIWPTPTDGLSGATVLDTLSFREGATIEEFWTLDNGFGNVAGFGYEWIAAGYLLGGLTLIGLKVIKWHAPVAMLVTTGALATLFYASGGSDSLGSPLFHWFAGGTIFAAFFIVTDPVTTPETERGMLLFAAGVALITFIIRAIGAYPDGIAFAVLLMNALVPLHEQLRLRTS